MFFFNNVTQRHEKIFALSLNWNTETSAGRWDCNKEGSILTLNYDIDESEMTVNYRRNRAKVAIDVSKVDIKLMPAKDYTDAPGIDVKLQGQPISWCGVFNSVVTYDVDVDEDARSDGQL